MIELSNSVKKCPAKMLLDSSATSNFISNAMVAALKMQVYDNEDFHELMLANGTIMPTTGYVQYVMNCGDYNNKIVVAVFPSLHKEHILGMPWLEYENPIIDWTQRQVTI